MPPHGPFENKFPLRADGRWPSALGSAIRRTDRRAHATCVRRLALRSPSAPRTPLCTPPALMGSPPRCPWIFSKVSAVQRVISHLRQGFRVGNRLVPGSSPASFNGAVALRCAGKVPCPRQSPHGTLGSESRVPSSSGPILPWSVMVPPPGPPVTLNGSPITSRFALPARGPHPGLHGSVSRGRADATGPDLLLVEMVKRPVGSGPR